MKAAGKKKATADHIAASKLARLRLKSGDVLVLHVGTKDVSASAVASSLRGWLKGNGLKNIGVLLLREGETVESLSEQRLREMGWIRPYEVIR